MSSPVSVRSSVPAADFLDRLDKRSAVLGVIGLGTVGLPLATAAAARGFRVVGFDLDPMRVRQVNDRTIHYEYEDQLRGLAPKRLRASTDSAVLRDADVVFVCVPTPVDDEGAIVLDKLWAAGESVASSLRRGTLVVLESSVEVGTTRRLGALLEERSGFKAGADFGLAYSPERYSPRLPALKKAIALEGKPVAERDSLTYAKIPRVVGGWDANSGERAQRVYQAFLDAPVRLVSSLEVAEAAKLVENAFRDVNIALVNEFAQVLGALGVDTHEVIQAAATKSFAFMPHYPGLVGGECVPVDTWYVIRQAQRLGVPTDLMRAARRVNDAVVEHVANAALRLLQDAGIPPPKAKVSILGTAYKANVYDDRVSPGRKIASFLTARGARVVLCDPVVQEHNHRAHPDLVGLDEALRDADVALLATDHDVFRQRAPESMARLMRTRLVVDARNAFDHEELRRQGFKVSAWGRAG